MDIFLLLAIGIMAFIAFIFLLVIVDLSVLSTKSTDKQDVCIRGSDEVCCQPVKEEKPSLTMTLKKLRERLK